MNAGKGIACRDSKSVGTPWPRWYNKAEANYLIQTAVGLPWAVPNEAGEKRGAVGGVVAGSQAPEGLRTISFRKITTAWSIFIPRNNI